MLVLWFTEQVVCGIRDMSQQLYQITGTGWESLRLRDYDLWLCVI